MIHLGDCGLKIPCMDCTSEVCGNAGKKQPDCPYKYCPYPHLDCETECRFIDEYIGEIRKRNDRK